jgi:hypothetical protein
MPKKAGKRAPESWLDLFDCSYKDSSCETVADSIKGVAFGEPSQMHVTLRRYLVRELDAYIASHWKPGTRQSHVEAAQHLSDAAERIAEKFEDRYPFAEDDAPIYAADLRSAWVEFIAEGAGHRMYHDRPREHAQRVWAAAQPRAAKRLTPAEVVRRMKAAGVAVLSQTLAADIGEAFSVSEKTVYRRLKEAKKKGLLS